MSYHRIIILLTLISSLTSGFPKFDININRQLLELELSQIDLSNVEEKWIEQWLDHFNLNETRTLNMRYFENLELWRQGGPIYIYINGEFEANSTFASADDRLLMSQMARETHGAIYVTEHRYYGKSLPNIIYENAIEYYEFLNSQQALADLVNLIMIIKSDAKFKRSKVVAVGGSYAGNLATWLRGLRPNLVDAAVAISAPLLAKADFHEAYDVVRNTFDKYGTPNCLKHIGALFKIYDELLKSAYGRLNLKRIFNICRASDLSVLENQKLFFYNAYYLFFYQAQFGTPDSVKQTCEMYDPDHYLLHQEYQNISDYGFDENCKTMDFENFSSVDAWTSQSCKEFGYLLTTSSEQQPFIHRIPLQFLLNHCKDVIEGDIESEINAGVAWTNHVYGGRTPRVSKVVFTSGDMDPWSALGVLQDLGPDAPAFVVNGTSHCATLLVRPDEPNQLKQTRESIKQIVKQWISTPLHSV